MSSAILWEIRNRVGHIVLNQPERGNPIGSAMAQALVQAVRRAGSADIGAVLISARGKQFSVGGDVGEFLQNRAQLPALIAQILDLLHPAMHSLATLPVPVISAIQGPLGGGGIGLALCADLVLAADNAFLRGGYAALGLSPDLGVSYYLARRAGAARAKYLLMSNRPVPAQDCLRLGLFDELHEPQALQAAAQALAEELAAGAASSMASIKRLCDAAHAQSLQAHLAAERSAMLGCARSTDCDEGITAFVEKRPPLFQGCR